MRKVLTVVVMCSYLLLVSSPALAAEVLDVFTYETPTPRMAYIASASCDLYIDSKGTATVKSAVNGYQGTTTKVSIEASLQQCRNGKWVTLKSFSESSNTYRTSLTKTYGVSKGYSYRVQSVIKAYSGSSVETQTVTSNEAKY